MIQKYTKVSNLSDFFINKHALSALGYETDLGYANSLYYGENTTPLALLALVQELKQGGSISSINDSLTAAGNASLSSMHDEKLATYLKHYGYTDELNMVKIVKKYDNMVFKQNGFFDLAHYMYVSRYGSINLITDEEYKSVSLYGKVLRIVEPSANIPTKMGSIVTSISDIYSKSEAFTIMFMDKESGYILFADETVNHYKTLNDVTYQLMMNYHYYISNLIRKHSFSNDALVRLKEFISDEQRHVFYQTINSMILSLGYALSVYSFDGDEVYDMKNQVIERVQILLISGVPVDSWNDFNDVPNVWLESLINDSGMMWTS